MISAAVQGRAHMKNDLPCQDYTYALHRNGVFVSVLADGAGSCSRSDIGAKLAAETTAYLLSEQYDQLLTAEREECVRIILDEIKNSIRNEPEYIEPLKEYSSTLLFVAVREGRYIAGHLGDGVIGGVWNGETFVLSPPDNGEFHNTTYFTTSEQAEERMRIYRGELEDISAFFLMSDGSADSLYNRRNSSLAPALLRMHEWTAKYPAEVVEEALLNNLEKVIREQTIDDCSLAIMALQKHAETMPTSGEEGEADDEVPDEDTCN